MSFLLKFCESFPKLIAAIVHSGLTLVYYYHLFSSSIFFNTAFDNAQGVEKLANGLLTPVHYLCGGQVASYDATNDHYQLDLRFDYHEGKWLYSPLALYFFSPSLMLGGLVKVSSFCLPSVREKYAKLKKQRLSTNVNSHNDAYRAIGLDINDFLEGEEFVSAGYERRPEDFDHLKIDKQALEAIAALLYKSEIPFWIDRGTLLGAYRYGGIIPWDYDVDIGVIADDFDNVMHALNGLDPNLYCAQDWSNRGIPRSYIRVYIKENHNHVDIFLYEADPVLKTFTFVLSYDQSALMADDWKTRERLYVKPLPFEMFFPLKKGNFDGLAVPVLQDSVGYLNAMYDNHLEPAKIYNVETEQYEKDLSHPYWQIPLVK